MSSGWLPRHIILQYSNSNQTKKQTNKQSETDCWNPEMEVNIFLSTTWALDWTGVGWGGWNYLYWHPGILTTITLFVVWEWQDDGYERAVPLIRPSLPASIILQLFKPSSDTWYHINLHISHGPLLQSQDYSFSYFLQFRKTLECEYLKAVRPWLSWLLLVVA